MTRRQAAAALIAIVLVGLVAAGAWAVTAGPLASAPRPVVPRFVEETATAGVAITYDGTLPYFTGGGVAVFDCDGDGRQDLYVAGGVNPAGLFRNESPVGGALRFEQLPAAETDLRAVTGAYPLDIDGDGILDLAVLRNGGNVLLRGLGGCRFEHANDRWGFDGGHASTMAFAATWEGAAALPTLAFGNYVDPGRTDPNSLCDDNVFLRPAADGRTYGPGVALSPGLCALSMLFSDWSRTGRRDLRISNDRHYYLNGEEQLWRIEAGQPPSLYTRADGWSKVNVEGMGIASYDLDGDGLPEVFLTSQGENRLQTLAAGPTRPTYVDIALKRNANAYRPFSGDVDLPSTAWHPEFVDVNNDGRIDLFISKGNVHSQPDYAQRDPSNLLLGGTDGTFVESADTAGILDFDRGRGAALADFNLDGLPDLVESNLAAPLRIWRNVGGGTAEAPAPLGHWLAVRLHQDGRNRDAIGSWLEVRTGDTVQRREITVGGGHSGGQLGWIHVGLGEAREADLRVLWPDGQQGPWIHVAADQLLDVDRTAGTATPWSPAAPSVVAP